MYFVGDVPNILPTLISQFVFPMTEEDDGIYKPWERPPDATNKVLVHTTLDPAVLPW